MIAGIFHEGSGLGNQLFRYVATRVLAKDKGYEWGMLGDFKGKNFMPIDMGREVVGTDHPFWQEKKVLENGVDIRSYDPEINFVQDNTIIDGELQDSRYFEHRLDEIDEWLKVEPLSVPDDLCIIGFRGGEYVGVKDLFLPYDYWKASMDYMRAINPNMRFEVHTDDPVTASMYFPFECIHDIGLNWRSIRYAKYAIIANSSFYILPRLLKHNEELTALTLAPRFWARRNTGVWALPQNYYQDFSYL